MKQRLVWLSVFLALTGCGFLSDSYQKVSDDFVTVMTKVNDVLESVRNASDAQSAVGKIEKLAVRVDELTLRVKKLAPPQKQIRTSDDFKARKERQQNRHKTALQRLNNNREIARILQPALMQLSRAIFDLDVVLYSYYTRSIRGSSGGPPGPTIAPAAHGSNRPTARTAAPGRPDAFQMARNARMRQLSDKHGSNRVAIVRFLELPLSVNRAKLYSDLRAAAKSQDHSMMTFPDELTILLAPVTDLQALARKIPVGKVTQIDPAARTIIVSAQ